MHDTEQIAYEIGIDKFTPLPAYVEDEKWAATNPEFRTELGNPERLHNCDRPWSHLNVRADGGVAPCCYTFFKKDDIGDLNSNDFLEIWNNQQFQQARRIIVQARKGERIEKSHIACYNCMHDGIRPSLIEISRDTQDQPEPIIKDQNLL